MTTNKNTTDLATSANATAPAGEGGGHTAQTLAALLSSLEPRLVARALEIAGLMDCDGCGGGSFRAI